MGNHFVSLPGCSATAEVTESAIYLTMSVRNVGNGVAILHGWRIELSRELSGMTRPPVEDFHRLTRDLYVAVGDVTFWQGTYRGSDGTRVLRSEHPNRGTRAPRVGHSLRGSPGRSAGREPIFADSAQWRRLVGDGSATLERRSTRSSRVMSTLF